MSRLERVPSARPSVPALAVRLLRAVVPAEHAECLEGDLQELFIARAARLGAARARRWYWAQVGHALAHAARRALGRRRDSIGGDGMMTTLARDLRYGVRSLARQPGFTAVAVLMLATGIGANATVFSWVNAVLLTPLPGVARSSEIAQFSYTFRGEPLSSVSYPDYVDIRDQTRLLSGVAARDEMSVSVRVHDATEHAWVELVSANFFDVLGVRPELGRALLLEDDAPGASPVAVLAHHFWRDRFGADASAIGRVMSVNGQPTTVVGVAPPAFNGGMSGLRFDLWMAVGTQPLISGPGRLELRGSRWLTVLTRLAPGVTRAQAEAELDAILDGWRGVHRGYDEHRAALFPLAESPTGGVSVLRPVLLVLMTVAGIVLLIACANLAALLLARASARRREMAIRLSVGATRWRLVQQLLVEGTVLALLGAIGAAIVLRWTSALLMNFAPPSELPIHLVVAVDARVLLFIAAVAAATVLLSALTPALQGSSASVSGALRDGARGAGEHSRHRLRRGLVAAQVALSMMLLVAAGLCVRSVMAARDVHPGFNAQGVVVGWLDLTGAAYDADERRQYFRRVLDDVRTIPGVEGATFARSVPLGFAGPSSTMVRVDGYVPAQGEVMAVMLNTVGPDYVSTMGSRLMAGRDVSSADVADAPPVAVINRTMAERFWGDRDPIGGRFTLGGGEQWITVAGVVEDLRIRTLTEPSRPQTFLPLLQYDVQRAVLHVRATGDPSSLGAVLEQRVRALNPDVPLFDVGTLTGYVGAATFQQELAADLLFVFGGLALFLASVGAYGVLAFVVGERRREIGIRLAIGASRAGVFALVLRYGAGVVALGATIGLGLSMLASLGLRGLLIGVGPFDPTTYAAVLGLIALMAAGACIIPARRAASVDPAEALRAD
jgi:predicted permease